MSRPMSADSPQRTCLEAIATRKLIRADYNGAELRLAPHLLFQRHGELFIGAFNPAKNRRSDAEPALGYFKLAGLHNLALTDESFEPLDGVDLNVPREGDELVFAV
mgnify:CR=1 FL=1